MKLPEQCAGGQQISNNFFGTPRILKFFPTFSQIAFENYVNPFSQNFIHVQQDLTDTLLMEFSVVV